VDRDRLARVLIAAIERDFRDDVSLVHVHGSTAYDDTHATSDLDLYIVAKTERAYRLGVTFILDGVGCDFWVIPWERLEAIARHDEAIAAIITEGAVIYYGDDADRARFAQLRAEALDVSDEAAWQARARRELDRAYHAAYRVHTSSTFTDARIAAGQLIYQVSFALAQWNLTTIKRGRRLLKSEILAMPQVPQDFGAAYEAIFAADDLPRLQAACRALMAGTAKTLSTGVSQPEPVAVVFAGWYEEMIQCYNKIAHACETGDPYTAFFAVTEFTAELDSLLARIGVDADLPDMVAAYDSVDLSRIGQVAREHQARFEAFLAEHGCPPRRFDSLDHLETYLSSLAR